MHEADEVLGRGARCGILSIAACSVLLCACPSAPPGPKECDDDVSPLLEMTESGTAFGTMVDNSEVLVGDGQQTGGSYVSLNMRVRGLSPVSSAYSLDMFADTLSNELIGQASYRRGLLCSNTGDNRGYLVSPALHIRLPGGDRQHFDGMEVFLRVRVSDDFGTAAQARTAVRLLAAPQ